MLTHHDAQHTLPLRTPQEQKSAPVHAGGGEHEIGEGRVVDRGGLVPGPVMPRFGEGGGIGEK